MNCIVFQSVDCPLVLAKIRVFIIFRFKLNINSLRCVTQENRQTQSLATRWSWYFRHAWPHIPWSYHTRNYIWYSVPGVHKHSILKLTYFLTWHNLSHSQQTKPHNKPHRHNLACKKKTKGKKTSVAVTGQFSTLLRLAGRNQIKFVTIGLLAVKWNPQNHFLVSVLIFYISNM